jgi:hypothetical protein
MSADQAVPGKNHQTGASCVKTRAEPRPADMNVPNQRVSLDEISGAAIVRFRDALLGHDWALPFILVHADPRSGRLSHSGPYQTEVAALVALDELAARRGLVDASLAQLYPPA